MRAAAHANLLLVWNNGGTEETIAGHVRADRTRGSKTVTVDGRGAQADVRHGAGSPAEWNCGVRNRRVGLRADPAQLVPRMGCKGRATHQYARAPVDRPS